MRRFDDFNVETLPVEHNPESIAYRITASDGASVVYSGDTDFSDNLVMLSKEADLLICESALPDELKVRGHLTPSLAGEIAKRANVRKLVLTHFYPECDLVDVKKECRKTYSGPLMLAEDLMTINI
jgi:ribonuclease BN (tRNA processing enzyme)